MGEAGLLSIWQQGASSEATYCVRKIQQEMNDQIRKGDKKRLSMNDLSGAFVILACGYLIDIVAFIFENRFGRIFKLCQQRRRLRERNNHVKHELSSSKDQSKTETLEMQVVDLEPDGVVIDRQKQQEEIERPAAATK